MNIENIVSYGTCNAGVDRRFDSLGDALEWAEYKWSRLTDREKVEYTTNGGYFLVQQVDETG